MADAVRKKKRRKRGKTFKQALLDLLQFSKLLMLMETAMVAWSTYKAFDLAEQCVAKSFSGSLPWITTALTLIWGAYGVSVKALYDKSGKENSAGGIVYETAMRQLNDDPDCDE